MEETFEEWYERAGPLPGISENDLRIVFNAGKSSGYLEAVHNHDRCKIHGYCGDCACGKASWEQEDWAHVG